MHFLITRPEPDASRLASELTKSGHQCTISPLLTLNYLDPGITTLTSAQGLIITSQNALRALHAILNTTELQNLARLPVFIVGTQTAAVARELGFKNIQHIAKNAHHLSQHIQENDLKDGGILNYITGTHVAFDMVASMTRIGIKIERTIVYNTELVPDFSPSGKAGLKSGAINAVMLLSPRTAGHYAKLIQKHDLEDQIPSIIHYCLSQNIATELKQLTGCPIQVASTPTMTAMRTLIEQNNSKLP